MEYNMLNEMSQLNCLLEKHKQLQERSAFKSSYQSQTVQNNVNNLNNENDYYNTMHYESQEKLSTSTTSKVYVNPNYTRRKPVIHINPRVQVKPSIYVNPKLIQNMTNSQNQNQISRNIVQDNPPVMHINTQSKCSVHVNPKSFNQQQISRSIIQDNTSVSQINIQSKCSVHVNPKSFNQQQFTRSIVQDDPSVSQTNIQSKCSVHVNPKSFNQQQITTSILQDNPSVSLTNIQSKCSVHVNPKLMTKLISKVPEENKIAQQNHDTLNTSHIQTTSAPTASVTQSKTSSSVSNAADTSNIPVRKKSITTVTSSKKKSVISSTPICQRKSSTNYIIRSRTKLVKNGATFKKSPNSSLVALSRRKLVRIKRSPKLAGASSSTSKSITPLRRRLSSSGLRKAKGSPKNVILTSLNQLSKTNNLKFISSTNSHWYSKINKSVSKSPCKKKIITTKKVSDNSVALVSIGGIMYKTSRNQLVRSSPGAVSLKRRRSLTSNKNTQYYIAKNGKKLLKLDATKKKINTSLVKLNTSITSVKSYKTNVSNKVKQRSLQILRNKMRKNNQPCLLFQRFGYCANQLKGTCPKLHDKKQVAVCRNFLQGKCLLDDCPLSHNVGPEKMPTCKYFLDGCCAREGCPYLHVKVSSKSPICVEFLRGYCPQANECQKRHIHACPEFDKSGKCSKGKFCPYPHKSHLTETKRFKGGARRKNNAATAKHLEKVTSKPEVVECRKRYYDETSEDLSQKREKLLKQMQIIKDVHMTQSNVFCEKKDSSLEQSVVTDIKDSVDCEEKLETLCNRPRRPPIGPLPAYIPID